MDNKITFADHVIDILINGELGVDYTYTYNYINYNFILKSLNRSTTNSIEEFNDTFELNCYKVLFIPRAILYRGNVFINLSKENKNKLIKAYDYSIGTIKLKINNENVIKAKREQDLHWWP